MNFSNGAAGTEVAAPRLGRFLLLRIGPALARVAGAEEEIPGSGSDDSWALLPSARCCCRYTGIFM
jgi:hypothetical protein